MSSDCCFGGLGSGLRPDYLHSVKSHASGASIDLPPANIRVLRIDNFGSTTSDRQLRIGIGVFGIIGVFGVFGVFGLLGLFKDLPMSMQKTAAPVVLQSNYRPRRSDNFGSTTSDRQLRIDNFGSTTSDRQLRIDFFGSGLVYLV